MKTGVVSRLSDFDKLALAGLVGVCALAAAVGLGLASLESLERSFPLCLFRAVTGIPCPGCGMAHALIFALNLRWAESFRAHPLGLPLLAAWIWRLARAARAELAQPRLAPLPAAAALSAIAAAYAVRLTS